MAEELTPDICVIGGGPGGVAVATAAASHDIPVVLVERARLGGANLSRGTIPSKALLAAANLHETLRRAPAFGVSAAPLQVNTGKVAEHVRAVVEAVAVNVSAERLTALGVRVVAGDARFVGQRSVSVGETLINARRFVIATGSAPVMPDLPGLAEIEPISLESVFDLERKPSHLLIVGAGGYALELAQAYTRLGMDCTVIDEGPALLGRDPELVELVLERLRAEGVRVRTGVKVASLARRRGGIRVTLAEEAGEVAVDGSHLIVLAGRAPAVAGLGLEAAAIAHDAGGIVVDRRMRTSNSRVFAIGDVVSGPASAARAEYEAACVLRSILYRLPVVADVDHVPEVTFTDPGFASVGLFEAEARARHKSVTVLRLPFIENDLSQAERTTAGLIKIVLGKGGRILGAAVVGRDAGEVIAPWALAIANRLDVAAVMRASAPYPSRAEIGRRVAATVHGPGQATGWQRGLGDFLKRFG